MDSIKIENIIAYAQLSESFDIENLAEKLPEFYYNPDDFVGLTFKLEDPKTAILLLPNGRAICTGAISIEEVETSILKVIEKITNAGIKINTKPGLEIQNIIVSTNVYKELNLDSISKGLLLKNINYEPDQFPGLIYNIDEIGALLLIFSSGKIVCSGTKNFEDAYKGIEMMIEKLSSLGAL
ncbi:MAG: TATA-box-binding protein [Thermoplasmatales archaeon]|nr:MAG: TATA-box-binding protein [Thermoplasmatales archaeon]